MNLRNFIVINIFNSDNGTIIRDALQLVIISVQRVDQGEWTCLVEGDEDIRKSFMMNVYSERLNCTATQYLIILSISFLVKIFFEPVANILKVNEYEDVTIRCEVKGHPQPTITWEHNGLSLMEKFDSKRKVYFNNKKRSKFFFSSRRCEV